MHLLIRMNFVRTKVLNLVKEQIKNVSRVGSSNTENYNKNISSKTLFAKNDLVHICYINLIDAIIRHQRLRLTCTELRDSYLACKSYREYLTLLNRTSKNSQTYFDKNL